MNRKLTIPYAFIQPPGRFRQGGDRRGAWGFFTQLLPGSFLNSLDHNALRKPPSKNPFRIFASHKNEEDQQGRNQERSFPLPLKPDCTFSTLNNSGVFCMFIPIPGIRSFQVL
jgi:hypothetical protein